MGTVSLVVESGTRKSQEANTKELIAVSPDTRLPKIGLWALEALNLTDFLASSPSNAD